MNKKFTLSVLASLFACTVFAQINSITQVTDVTCNGASDGQINFLGIEGCFAPITAVIDTNDTAYFPTLTNNGYQFINHGAGTGGESAVGVWAGATSIGDVYIATGTFEDSITFDTITLYANTGADQSGWIACFDQATSACLWAERASAGSGTYVSGFTVTALGDYAYMGGYLEGTTLFGSTSVVSSGSYQGYVARFHIPTGALDTVVQVGNAGDEEVLNLHAGPDGRIYVCGDFTNTITLGGSNYPSAGGIDAFVTCYNADLTVNYWGATGGGTNEDVARDLVTEFSPNGDIRQIYAVGYFKSSSATFGSSVLSTNGNNDMWIAKVDTLGSWQWAISAGGSTQYDQAYALDISDDADTIYVVGSFGGSVNFGFNSLAASGTADGFILYVDSNGVMGDVYQFGGASFDAIYDVTSVDNKYLVFGAAFAGSFTYADSTFAATGGADAFAGKIGPGFHEIWGKNFGGTNADAANSICIGEAQDMHLAGFFAGNASAYQTGLISQGSAGDAYVTNETFWGMGDTNILLTGLAPGDYYIVMYDSNGSFIIDTITVNEPAPLLISGVVTNASSGSASDGAVDLSVSGGTPGYSYTWSNTAITEDISGLPIGTYTVTVTDTNGCFDTASFVIDTGFTVMSIYGVVTDMICGGDSSGAIDLFVNGGVSPYTYNWSNGASSQDLSNLAGGWYTVTVNDNDTSTLVDSFYVFEPPILNVSGTITPPTNGTSNDGAVDLTVSGGIPSYTFNWSNSASTEDISGLPIGLYTVTVTDSIGCTVVRSYFVDTIPALSIVLQSTDVTCLETNNGTIDLTVIGGVPPFVFNWSNGATTEDQSGLPAGTYTVTVTDSVNQVVSDAAVVGSNPQFPNPTVGPITGATSAQAWTSFNYNVPTTNGSAFAWNATGGTVTNTASNAAVVLWYGGPTAQLYVTETDANGCMATDSLEVVIIFVGVEESNNEHAVLIYPNPAHDVLNVQLPSVFSNVQLQLMDIQGRMVQQEMLVGPQHEVNISNLSPGTYLLQMSNGQTSISHKILVQ